jgi:hypothetical protein
MKAEYKAANNGEELTDEMAIGALKQHFQTNMAQIQSVGTMNSNEVSDNIFNLASSNGTITDASTEEEIDLKLMTPASDEVRYSPATRTFQITVKNSDDKFQDVTIDGTQLGDMVGAFSSLGSSVYEDISNVKDGESYLYSVNARTGKLNRANAKTVKAERRQYMYNSSAKGLGHPQSMIEVRRPKGSLTKEIILITKLEGEDPEEEILSSGKFNAYLMENMSNVLQPKNN